MKGKLALTLPMIIALNLDPRAAQILKGRIVIHRENLYCLESCTEEEYRVLNNSWERLRKSLNQRYREEGDK